MAKAKRAAAKARAMRGPKCCECPGTIARKEFRAAKSCAAKGRALDNLKRLATEEYDMLKPPARRLLYRELLMKSQQVQDACAREESADAARFNGFGRMRARRRRRRR